MKQNIVKDLKVDTLRIKITKVAVATLYLEEINKKGERIFRR